MNYREWFINWFKTFNPTTNEWVGSLGMHTTVENSPWHRENSVWTHTCMVVEEYLNLSPVEWTIEDLYGALALSFHDTGKPSAREEVVRDDGSVRVRFGGHEKISACLWREYLVSHNDFDEIADKNQLFFPVAWMIEYHLPYDYKDKQKRENLKATVDRLGISNVFNNVLTADCYGRISDDHAEKKQKVHDWIVEFSLIKPQPATTLTIKKVTLLVGPSGSGKSTYITNECDGATVYSFDKLRLEWYSDETITDPVQQYEQAFRKSTQDSKFDAKSSKEFTSMIKDPNINHVVVDNTNLSAKVRRQFVAAAHQHGWKVECVLFVVPKATLIARQHSRGDKFVREEHIERQFNAYSVPCFGDVDSVTVEVNG